MRTADIERIEEITIEAWRPAFEHRREEMGEELFAAVYGEDWEATKAGIVRGNCENESDYVYVATIDDEIVGFVTVRYNPDSGIGEIGNNAVDPAAQGRGIGTQLYEFSLDKIWEQGMSFAEVRTSLIPQYAPARRAYEKVGFDIELPKLTYYQEL